VRLRPTFFPCHNPNFKPDAAYSLASQASHDRIDDLVARFNKSVVDTEENVLTAGESQNEVANVAAETAAPEAEEVPAKSEGERAPVGEEVRVKEPTPTEAPILPRPEPEPRKYAYPADHKPIPATPATDSDKAVISACSQGNLETVSMLLPYATNVNSCEPSKSTPLEAAVRGRFHDIARLLLDSGANPNIDGGHGSTALRIAITNDDVEMVQLLLAYGADPALEDPAGTPLKTAVNFSRPKILELLLKAGADAKSFDILRAASQEKDPRLAELLLDYGADINAVGNGSYTPLKAAVTYDCLELVKLLLARDADVHFKLENGSTALMDATIHSRAKILPLLLKAGANPKEFNVLCKAAATGHDDIVMMLLDASADVNARGMYDTTPLKQATMYGHESTVKLLLSRGADVHAMTGDDGTGSVLMDAVIHNKPQIAKILLEAGADPNSKHVLVKASETGQNDIVDALLDRGADIEAVGRNGERPLRQAVLGDRLETVKLLLHRGAQVNAQAGTSSSPIMTALFNTGTEILNVLIDAGADIRPPVLHRACERHALAAQLLVEKGADVNARDGNDMTPLQAAVRMGKEDVVHLLLDAGADVNAVGHGGTALGEAAKFGRNAIVQLLLEKGARHG
jgi:ankyrin repeat protein